ncbi:MAG: thymidylate synthase [Candidatus Binatia bacterium]
MSHNSPLVIESSCLSHAWGRAFLHTFENSKQKLSPLMLGIVGLSDEPPAEDSVLRDAVDTALELYKMNSVRVSGLTIFPYEMWVRRGRQGCKEFSEFCVDQFLPRLKARDRRNCYGTYFERMMRYSGDRNGSISFVNQLEFVVDLLKRPRKSRYSALQMTCLDPAKDHTGQAVRGFPCLQQISVAQDGQGRIAINAYYPTQYIFDRGYGNYVGLCHLGHFVAYETGLEFVRLNCFIGQPILGDQKKVTKQSLRSLADIVRARTEDEAD